MQSRGFFISVISLLHRIYKVTISPFLGNRCRFYPSCSDYCKEALIEHGFLKGLVLSCKRICKCHPLHEGGLDPVPQKATQYKH